MFDLFKKIVNYFTPLDEEAEVEMAAGAASVVNSDDECLATRTTLDNGPNNKPALPATPELPAESAARELSESSKATAVPEIQETVRFQPSRIYPKHAQRDPCPTIASSDPQSNMVQVDPAKKKRVYRSLNPGEGKFKVDVDPLVRKTHDNPAPTTTSRKGKKRHEKDYWTYDMNGNPLFLSSQITTEITTARTTNKVPELNGTMTAAATSKSATTEAKDEATSRRKGRPLGSKNKKMLVSSDSQDQIAATSTSATTKVKDEATSERRGRPPGSKNKKTKSELGKRKEKEPKTKMTTAESTPTATKRQRLMRKDYSENHTTRGRSKKLGKHQCLICGETFFDLKARDNHATTKHPRTTKWKH